MSWMVSHFGLPFTILLLLIAAFAVYVFGMDVIGLLVRALLFLVPPLRYKTDSKINFHLHAQSELTGYPWGIGFNAWGRKFFYFYDYMGWHNLSELHHRNNCDDHAYCPWHGSL